MYLRASSLLIHFIIIAYVIPWIRINFISYIYFVDSTLLSTGIYLPKIDKHQDIINASFQKR